VQPPAPVRLIMLRIGAAMAIPHYINEIISDVRRIKPGWYAMDDVGDLSSGPYSSHAECLGGIPPGDGSIPLRSSPK
jgi:hypothetical protein